MNKTKLSWFTYITDHLLRAWVQSWTYNFKMWADLMTNNYEMYANPYGESSERECYEWFWTSINMDDTLTKEYIESLYQMMDDIDTGKVRTYSAEDVLKRMKELVDKDS